MPKVEGMAAQSAPATIIVSLPADAKLTIDGSTTRSTSATRTFVTPALETAKDYTYNLRAEVVRNGQTLSTERQVNVRGGLQTTITLDIPVASVAAR